MNKIDMASLDIFKSNVEKIREIFPNVFTEEGDIYKLDFEKLKNELSENILINEKEKYQLTWPGKSKAILNANQRTTSTLIPLYEKSVNFENTKNVYIEGDNLDTLKILPESYLKKIKCIYIDPPYNTGNDFIYNDNYDKSSAEELLDSGQTDEQGNRLISNSNSNGRFHSDWLSMMYSRLKLARNLLTDDGVIFISIDDNEQDNLKKICSEIFGEYNFIIQYVWEKHKAPKNDNKYVTINHEYILVYAKNKEKFIIKKDPRSEDNLSGFKNEDNDPRGKWISGPLLAPTFSSTTVFPIKSPNGREIYPPAGKCWSYNQQGINKLLADNRIWFGSNGNNVPRIKRFLSELPDGIVPRSLLFHDVYGGNQKAANELKKLFDDKKIFDYSKPVDLIKYFIDKSNDKEMIVLDFFSGSATTAHAVMKLNSEDKGNRKYIMVQIPEKCELTSEAYKNGYKTICDIGEDRIKRAAKKIKNETGLNLDYGFRVFKVTSSNMKDEYYMTPDRLSQEQIKLFEDNIKEDRTPEDLIIQILLNLGLKLDLPIKERIICGNKVFDVDDGELLACFDNNVNIDIIEEIAKIKPRQVVFRDSSFATDQDKVNFEERLKRLSAGTKFNVL